MHRRHLEVSLATAVFASLVAGCAERPSSETGVIRLVDVFTSDAVSGQAPQVKREPRAPWRFDGPAPPGASGTRGFVAGTDVAGLVVRDGRLEGRTTGEIPMISVERRAEPDDADQLHAVEIRMRVSAGSTVSMIAFAQPPDFAAVRDRVLALPWRLSAPVTSGDELQTYTLTAPAPQALSTIRHLVIRPTDAAGATFAVESVRLVSRREHLAGLPSGVGWQGLRDVYRESLVSRPGESLRFPLVLPRGARLTLGVGTIEPEPLTFRVTIVPRTGPSEVVLERSVSTPFRWEEPKPLDLARFAGRPVTLSLTLEGGRPDAVGLWGSPVVRGVRATAAGAPRKPRGVIVVQADTLRRDTMDVYGYSRETTPRLRALAAQGVLFRRAVSQAPWTKVSTTSILTSLYPTTHGVSGIGDRLPASAETLAEVYRAAGYTTLQLSSNSFTGFFTGLHQGFEELHEDGSLASRGTPYPSKSAREYVDRLADWLGRRDEAPFFVFLHITDPHPPYEPRSPYDRTFAAPSAGEIFRREMKSLEPHIANPAFKRMGMATRGEVQAAGLDPAGYVGRARDFYDGSVRGLDAEMGRFVERLRDLGLDQDTLLVFLSDHGHELQDHGAMWHGHSLYRELMDVPLFFRWPNGLAGRTVVEERVQLIDVMPTVLELSGVRAPAGVQGRSLMGLLRRPSGALAVARAAEAPPVISERVAPSGIEVNPEVRAGAAVISGDYKLIHNRDRDPGVPEYELYDLAADPREQTNLAAGKPEVVARLAHILEAFHKSALQARLKPDSEAAAGMSPEQLERLRALGYIK